MFARLINALAFDALLRHPIVTLSDIEDSQLVDEANQLIDMRHPAFDETCDWYFRVARRHHVLWFEVDQHGGQAVALHARAALGAQASYLANPSQVLSAQFDAVLVQWLRATRLPLTVAFPMFSLADLTEAGRRLVAARRALAGTPATVIPPKLLDTSTINPQLHVAYLRVLGQLFPAALPQTEATILSVHPAHAVARRRALLAQLDQGAARTEMLGIIADAPMYAKPHLSVWGTEFGVDAAGQKLGIIHQGIAASLAPESAIACHNYSALLAEQHRLEESYRWADRATVVSPEFGAAQLDCVRRLRQLARPTQAFSEAQYRCKELIERLDPEHLGDLDVIVQSELLLAFAHFDLGRLDEAIAIADRALARIKDPAHAQATFAWAHKRVTHWKQDPGVFARAYAWDAHHRGAPGRVREGISRARISDAEDVHVALHATLALGQPEMAWFCWSEMVGTRGGQLLGDGKARLEGAKALILCGELMEALEQIQIVQLRRGGSRFEAEINRLLRLAACRSASEWDRVITRRLDQGATELARRAARDLADFVPRLNPSIVEQALGPRAPVIVDISWLHEFAAAIALKPSDAQAVLDRLALPAENSLRAADALAQDWWTTLVPPGKDREAHCAGALLALGVSLAYYLALCSGPPTPIAGAYRTIATEALQLVRRSRYKVEPTAIVALLALLEHLHQAPEWLLDTWLLRIERTFDLEAEQGSLLEGFTHDLPTIKRLLRGDERVGWEYRMALALMADATQYPAAAAMFERVARATEGGAVYAAWSLAAQKALLPAQAINVHWLACLANPSDNHVPWAALANCYFDMGRGVEALAFAERALLALDQVDPPQRQRVVARLEAAWDAAAMDLPFDGDDAAALGIARLDQQELEGAILALRWAAAAAPKPVNAQRLALAYCRAGRPQAALRALGHDVPDAALLVGHMLIECNRWNDALAVLRYGAPRFKTVEAWATLAMAATRANHYHLCKAACEAALAFGELEPGLAAMYVTALYRSGDFARCEAYARELLGRDASEPLLIVANHALARALAGLGRHSEAAPYLAAAAPSDAELPFELRETQHAIQTRSTPSVTINPDATAALLAFAKLQEDEFVMLQNQIGHPDWGVYRAALAALAFRGDGVSTSLPAAALDAAAHTLARTEGAINLEAAQLRILAWQLREAAFIQIDPPAPLGVSRDPDEFAHSYDRRLETKRERSRH